MTWTSVERFLNDRVALHAGDCREVLEQLEENSIDSCVTDPPYHLTSIVKRFGGTDAAPAQFGSDGRYARASAGFMGKIWDGGDIAFRPETWAAVYRVLKPGAHLVAMGGTRTYHRMACAIEDAGFEIRDTVLYLYGSGFPKSHDVSKGIDRAAGAEREIIRERELWGSAATGGRAGQYANGEAPKADGSRKPLSLTVAATDAARQWEGWGTALKPACELIVLARKPLSEGTVAANVLRWGTGAINVGGCRVGDGNDRASGGRSGGIEGIGASNQWNYQKGAERPTGARWPANVVHDGSDEVVAAFPETHAAGSCSEREFTGWKSHGELQPRSIPNDSGSAARFFYTAKADADDRLGSKHPTVKPLDLMQWLVRLVTPKNGTCLDCFAGTGTTGEAAWREGMRALLIEAEPEYQADIRRRMALALAGPDERNRESIKAKNLPRDEGPLFASRETWTEMWSRPFDFSREPKA